MVQLEMDFAFRKMTRYHLSEMIGERKAQDRLKTIHSVGANCPFTMDISKGISTELF